MKYFIVTKTQLKIQRVKFVSVLLFKLFPKKVWSNKGFVNFYVNMLCQLKGFGQIAHISIKRLK